jgi:hypothetical protein
MSFAKLLKELEPRIKAHKLAAVKDRILKAATPCVRFVTDRTVGTGYDAEVKALRKAQPGFKPSDFEQVHEAYQAHLMQSLPLGHSRFGGLPDLPPSIAWPTTKDGRKLHFIAQIDLSTVPAVPDRPLPQSGWLYLFIDDSPDTGPWTHVMFHHDGPRKELRRAPRPAEGELISSWNAHATPHDLLPVTAELSVSLPIPQGASWDTLWPDPGPTDKLEEAYVDLISSEEGAGAGAEGVGALSGQLLGYADTSGWNTNDVRPASRRKGREKAADWMPLLVVNSRGSMLWSDCGELIVLIHASDLAKGDFTKTENALICG